MTEFFVHPDEITRCARNVGGLAGTSTKLNDAATTASVPAYGFAQPRTAAGSKPLRP